MDTGKIVGLGIVGIVLVIVGFLVYSLSKKKAMLESEA